MKTNLLIILLTVFSFNTINAEVTWKISDDGTLTISGTDMPDYYYTAYNDIFHVVVEGSSAPWLENKDKIKKIVIKNGVTNIGSGAFFSCDSLRDIILPNSITSIADVMFQSCDSLSTIIDLFTDMLYRYEFVCG